MSPFVSPSIFMLISVYSLMTKQVMDFQKELSGWLGEATLFPAPAVEDSLLLSLDDFINCTGEVKEQDQTDVLNFDDVSDFLDTDGWMDEKIDLSILDSAQDWLPPSNDADKLMPEEAPMTLEFIIDSDVFSSPLNVCTDPIDIPKIEKGIGFLPQIEEVQCLPSRDLATSASDLSEIGLQQPSSPLESSVYSNCSLPSPSTSSEREPSEVSSLLEIKTFEGSTPQVFCIEVTPEVAFFSEVATRKPLSGKDLSLLRSSKARSKPYARSKQCKRDRKKVQNKEAAARYREKKRSKDKTLSDEVDALEAQQFDLQDKHDKLHSEVKYLKSLMREMFKARGILK